MARSSGLGKGLSSIIPGAELADTDTTQGAVMADVPIASVSPNPHQPRVHFDEESLTELSASIAEMGVLQPILVRPLDDGAFELIAGERRWRAAQRAGLTTIPAVIRLTDDVSSVEQALVENLHRQDLTALEEAAAYQQLLDEFGLTHDQVATRVGKSRSAITNSLRLLGLPPAVQHLLADGQLERWTCPSVARNPGSGASGTTRPRGSDRWVVGAHGRGGRPRGRSERTGRGRRRSRARNRRWCWAHPLDEVATAWTARTRASVGRTPRHARECPDDRQEGSSHDRVR